jgi:hypothetical protein
MTDQERQMNKRIGLDNLNREKWQYYVNYALDDNNEPEQCFRVFEILLEDFDWHFEYSDDHQYYEKYRQRQVDLRRVRNSLSAIDEKKANRMYNKASPWR